MGHERRGSSGRRRWNLPAAGLLLLLQGAAPALAGDGLPGAVVERFEAAVELHGPEATFVGSCTMIEEARIATLRGEVEESLRVVGRITRQADGTVTSRLEECLLNGRDRTGKYRREYEEEMATGVEEEPVLADVLQPIGEGSAYYRFGEVRLAEGVASVDYEPRAGAPRLDGLVRGTISWDAATLDPLEVTFSYIELPKKFREFKGRVRYTRHGDTVYLTSTTMEALMKVSLFKRRVTVEVRFEGIEPAASAGS